MNTINAMNESHLFVKLKYNIPDAFAKGKYMNWAIWVMTNLPFEFQSKTSKGFLNGIRYDDDRYVHELLNELAEYENQCTPKTN